MRAKTIVRQNAGRASDHEELLRHERNASAIGNDRCNAIKTRSVHRHADCTLRGSARPAIIAKSAEHACTPAGVRDRDFSSVALFPAGAIIEFLE